MVASPIRGTCGPVEQRIYPAPVAPLSVVGLPPSASLVRVATADGLDLQGIALAPAVGRPILLAFHGNGSSAADAVRWLASTLPDGFGLIAAEYRGYSGNPGKPSEAGLAADADAFMHEAERLAAGAPVWIIGHSLGGGVALALARRHPVAVVITLGAFTRLRDAAPKFSRAFVPNEYDNTGIVPLLQTPYFLVHGSADDVIPIAQGEALHRLAGKSKRAGASFVVIGANHLVPQGAMTAILPVVDRYLHSGQLSAATLPAAIKLVPFGQIAPLNP